VIGLAGLKDVAYRQILASLNPKNILRELSSPFTFKYDEIREAQYGYLSQHWVEWLCSSITPD
jgi:hypothetical protein